MYSVDTNMSHVPKHIKITFYQIVTEMQGSQKWQFDKIWFYKLLYDSLLNSLLQTWQLGKKLMPESSQGNPYLWSPIWRGRPIVNMKRQTPTGPEKWIPLSSWGRGHHVKVFKNGPSKICGRQSLKNSRHFKILRLSSTDFYLIHSWIPWPKLFCSFRKLNLYKPFLWLEVK